VATGPGSTQKNADYTHNEHEQNVDHAHNKNVDEHKQHEANVAAQKNGPEGVNTMTMPLENVKLRYGIHIKQVA
jgi:hypothetical protein